MKSEGGSTSIDSHLFKDTGFGNRATGDENMIIEENEDDSTDSIDGQIEGKKRKSRVSGFVFFKIALLVIMKRVMESKHWISKFGKTKIMGGLSGISNFLVGGYGGSGSVEK